jgi:peptidoglycan hydrolase-like protein with peptidoglycan-binding domain
MKNPARTGKIIIVLGVLLLIAFIIMMIISARQERAGTDPLLPDTFPNPFSTPRAPTGQVGTDGQVVTIEQPNTGITVKPQDPLVQLTTFPITGYAIIPEKGTDYFVRTNAYDVGYIYDIIGIDNPQLVQQTTSLIQNAGQIAFGSSGEVFMRYYDDQNYSYEAYFGMLQDSLDRVACSVDFPVKPIRNQTGSDIEQLQFYLTRYLGVPMPAGAGVFDEETIQLVRDFQKRQGLKPDGVLGQKSISLLRTVCTNLDREVKAAQLAESRQPRYVLSGKPQTGEVQTVVVDDTLTRMFYTKTTVQGIRGYVRLLDPVSPDKEVYRLPFSEWDAKWVGQKRVQLTTKPSAYALGYSYALDTETATMQRTFGPRSGLTVKFDSTGEFALVGESVPDGYRMQLVRQIKGQDPVVTPIGLVTFPEKCGFAPDSQSIYCMVPETVPRQPYPDAWYQSLVTFQDAIWRIETTNGRVAQVDTFSSDPTPRAFDAIEIMVSPDNRMIYFKDFKTGFLWRYDTTISPIE